MFFANPTLLEFPLQKVSSAPCLYDPHNFYNIIVPFVPLAQTVKVLELSQMKKLAYKVNVTFFLFLC